MNAILAVRAFRPDDAPRLFEVFHSAIHRVAERDYTAEQLQAWAPSQVDPALWLAKMQALDPFVADRGGVPVGYADLQSSGYIDHFFVSGEHPRQGIGGCLMRRLLEEAQSRKLHELTAHVSRTAQPFFAHFGFEVVELREPRVRGVVVPNALMRRTSG